MPPTTITNVVLLRREPLHCARKRRLAVMTNPTGLAGWAAIHVLTLLHFLCSGVNVCAPVSVSSGRSSRSGTLSAGRNRRTEIRNGRASGRGSRNDLCGTCASPRCRRLTCILTIGRCRPGVGAEEPMRAQPKNALSRRYVGELTAAREECHW